MKKRGVKRRSDIKQTVYNRAVPERPSRIWKDLPAETRQAAAAAFWRDESAEDTPLQHAEAVVAIARRLNFRPKSVSALPEDKRARYLAQMSDLSDAVATRALIAYHFQSQRPLMSAFLDALGVTHENGLITAESVAPPDTARIAAAVERVHTSFAEADLRLYLRTLVALDAETWAHVPPNLLFSPQGA